MPDTPSAPPPDTDLNLLFGVLAFQADLIDAGQLAQAGTLWAARKGTPLADLLLEQGWITPRDREHLDYLVGRKIERHGGARAGLADAARGAARRALASLSDGDVQRSLADLPTPDAGGPPPRTVACHADALSRYTLARVHAQGGIGEVWLARDVDLGREVALKQLLPHRAGSPPILARFLEEAKITGQLEHPGIIPVYELARRPDGAPFYTMRFARGRTLSEAVREYHARRAGGKAGPLEQVGLLNAFVAVCHAVAYAHSRGVIHRDLKPSNIILGDFGEVLVMDWGLAKLGTPGAPADGPGADTETVLPLVFLGKEGSRDETVQGQVLGTPAYMAPEQAAGRPDLVGPRSDVYGLGAILYEILTGRPPFRGPDTQDVLRQVCEQAPPRPREVFASVPPALEAVGLRALAKKPADRYASAADLDPLRPRDDFKKLLAGLEKPEAPPTPPGPDGPPGNAPAPPPMPPAP
jgi:serine/threonine protein kinase